MQYLREEQYYIDLYDLMTIKHCLHHMETMQSVYAKMNSAKELNHMSDSEKTTQFDMLFDKYMAKILLNEYNGKEKLIAQWIERDRKRQDLEDNTPAPPNVLCDNCGAKMKATSHNLHSGLDEADRVIFFFNCSKCKARKAVFENGEKREHKPDLCKKCGAELEHNLKFEGDIETWSTTCTGCDFKEVEVTNTKDEDAEREKQRKADQDLLAKYRDKFCLTKEKAEEIANSFEEIAFANEVYEFELQKYDDPSYELELNVKKLSIVELETLLNKELQKTKFDKLKLKEPVFTHFVDVTFTTQDYNTQRRESESTWELRKLINKTLETTNWRLHSNNVSYRMGYLTGQLRGYDSDEDIRKLLVKKDPKPKKVLDPAKLEKYNYANAVQLARMSAEFEAKNRLRLKRYEKEPDGFIYEPHSQNYYTCNLCHKSIRGNETWWLPKAILCFDCKRNLKEGVFPIEIFEDYKLHFHDWDLEHEFGLHPATIRKFVRNGELVTRDLKDSEGKTYYSIFMAEDNINFFKTHERVREREKRWHFVDKNGEIVWL